MYVYITKSTQYWDTSDKSLNANTKYADMNIPAYTNFQRLKEYLHKLCWEKTAYFNRETEKHISSINEQMNKFSSYRYTNSGEYTREQLNEMKNKHCVTNYASLKIHFYDYKENKFYEEYIQIDRYKVI